METYWNKSEKTKCNEKVQYKHCNMFWLKRFLFEMICWKSRFVDFILWSETLRYFFHLWLWLITMVFQFFFRVAMWSVIECWILHVHTWHWGISGYGLEITVKIFYEFKREKKENWHKIILHRSIHVFEHTIFPLKFLFSVVFISALPSNVTQEPVSGSDLYCYECKEIYKKGYDPLNSSCRNNVTAVGVRQCLPEHRYCVVSNPSDCFISVRSKT